MQEYQYRDLEADELHRPKQEQDVLMEHLRGDDESLADAAFTIFYKDYAEPLTREARKYAEQLRYYGSTITAADLVHDVFHNTWRIRKSIDLRNFIWNYLRRAVHNRAQNAIRDAKGRKTLPMDMTPESTLTDDEGSLWQEVVHKGPSPEDTLERKELGALIDQAVQRELNPYRQELFHLKYVEQLQDNEIAERMGIPIGTVKSGLSRIRGILKAYLAPRLGRELS